MSKNECIMTWRTFLNLMRREWEHIGYEGGEWYFKGTEVKIRLRLTDDIIEEGTIYYIY